MAISKLKNATVEKAFNGGKGYQVSENFTKQDGSQGKTIWKVWFTDPTALKVGAKLDISGFHSDKVVEFEGREGNMVRIVERSINSARVDSENQDDGFLPDDDGDAF